MATYDSIEDAGLDQLKDSSYPDPDDILHFPWPARNLSLASQKDWDIADHTVGHRLRSAIEDSDPQGAELVQDSTSEMSDGMDFEFLNDSTQSDESVVEADTDLDVPKTPSVLASIRRANRKRGIQCSLGKVRVPENGTRDEGVELQLNRATEEPARRSTRGIKRGPRKPIEPSAEFKSLHSSATEAFIDGDFDEAEDLINQAIRLNPEIFTAHSLLSEIHFAQGDNDRSVAALFNGAHTRPRDIDTWLKVEKLIMDRAGDDRSSSVRGAIYCLNRIIEADSTHLEARLRRADLYRELGKSAKAAYDYTRLLKQVPHDLGILRNLAEMCIELDQTDRAIVHYEETIAYLQTMPSQKQTCFEWSDANIYAELLMFSYLHTDGLAKIKSVLRWLLGRGKDTLWDNVVGDDREFDMDDEPRRTEVPDFQSNFYPLSTYGEGLPLELRVKLGILRLLQGEQHFHEALHHFEWLEPNMAHTSRTVQYYADLFREVADALRMSKQFEEALRFYGAIEQGEASQDAIYYAEMAACFRQVGMLAEAEEYYGKFKTNKDDNLLIQNNVAALFDAVELRHHTTTYQEELLLHRRRKYRTFAKGGCENVVFTLPGADMAIDSIEPEENTSNQFLLQPMTMKKLTRGRKRASSQVQQDLRPAFHRMSELKPQIQAGNGSPRCEWMTLAEQTLGLFKEMRVFFPLDRQTKFFGYSKESKARALQSRAKQSDGLDEVIIAEDIPSTYCEVLFDDWLDVLLEYAILLAEDGNLQRSYSIVKMAISCNIWFHSEVSLFLIYIVWAVCALIANDDESLCSISRFFMREYQFVTDSYRLYSALHRYCQRPHLWYNSSASQKYILRQVKAIDFSLIGEERALALYNERATLTSRDHQGNMIRAKSMDVALLMLYGQMLYAGGSYAYALNYFYRAYSLDAVHPLINLSIALGYIHHALKRQSDNRHALIMQGLSFLFVYYDNRITSGLLSQRQEATYNAGRTFHMLGLAHLAIKYYEQCLELSLEIRRGVVEDREVQGEDFAQEAAYALQCLWAAAGNMEKAREVAEEWMVLD